MPSIKDNMKEAILNKIANEEKYVEERRELAFSQEEFYQLRCEENFLNQLRKLVESL